MSAMRLIPREQWAARLEDMDCLLYRKAKPLKTAEYWVTKHDRVFVVTADESGRLRQDDWQLVLVQIAKLRPIDFDS